MPWTATKYCVSIMPRSLDDLHRMLAECRDADVLELRLDFLGDIDLGKLRQAISQPVIITVRLPEEGGYWKEQSRDRQTIFQKAIDARMDYIDIEWRVAPQMLPLLRWKPSTKCLISDHNTEHDLDRLLKRFREMVRTPADLYKFIYTARNLSDNLALFRLIREAQDEQVDYIIHAGGDAGQLSRILGALEGNRFTYVTLPGQPPTARGQLELPDAKDVYALHEKNMQTRRIGLLGFPLVQSRGWQLHNRLLKLQKLKAAKAAIRYKDFIYLNFPEPDFENFWMNWGDTVDRLSITIPHKEKIVPRLDFTSHSVEITGVCNTALRREETWWGFNTDFLAILEILQEYCAGFTGGFLIYGTGATARSTIAAIKEFSREPVFLTGRNSEAGERLAANQNIEFVPQESLKKTTATVLIQTTPLGMFPLSDESPPLDHLLPDMKLVFDVVYNPAITSLLQKAQQVGCKIVSGEEMYLRQAQKQCELFTGLKISMEEIRPVWDEMVKVKQ